MRERLLPSLGYPLSRLLPRRLHGVLSILLLVVAMMAGTMTEASPPLRGDDVPPDLQGVDVLQVIRDIKHVLGEPESTVAKGKPWESEIAALTDSRPQVHNAGMVELMRRGPVVLSDLALLAGDQNWQVRARVVEVAAAIGGDAGTVLVVALSHDPEQNVRELAAGSLGLAHGAGALQRLSELITSDNPVIRESAARGLGALGDPRGLKVLCGFTREHDDLVVRAMRNAITTLALQQQCEPMLASMIQETTGDQQRALVESTFMVGDPRLCPALCTALLSHEPDTAFLAARALAANGDGRAIEPLCQVASSAAQEELRQCAAETLQRLTGFAAAAGPAWNLWWRDHHGEVETMRQRDEFFAHLRDPGYHPTRQDLQRFTVVQLAPLLDGALGASPPWWPARAFSALRVDEPGRWSPLLFQRISVVRDINLRLSLIILLDQLSDPAAADGFAQMLAQDTAMKGDPTRVALSGAEKLAIHIALERRAHH